jgi:hypothetical protein
MKKHDKQYFRKARKPMDQREAIQEKKKQFISPQFAISLFVGVLMFISCVLLRLLPSLPLFVCLLFGLYHCLLVYVFQLFVYDK